jgi:hypothetical protein
MTTRPPVTLQDTPVNRKVVLSGLWVTTLVVFAYVDIFGFWRADIIRGALDGTVPGPGFTIGQAFLTLTTLYVVVPALMIMVSLLAPARVNRVAQLVVGPVYLLTIVGGALGETWAYYLIGSAVEVALLAAVTYVAWSWPRAAAVPRRESARLAA